MTEQHLGHSKRVVVDWDGEWWTISDEHGEFARATDRHQALAYVRDLMGGPSSGLTMDMLLRQGHGKTERLR